MNKNSILSELNEGIGIITLNRPQHYNSFTKNVLLNLEQILSDWKEDDDCRAVIVTGAGEKAFSSGADINSFLEERKRHMGVDWSRMGQRVLALFDNLGKPTISALNGLTLGGGLELALACTFRIACSEAKLGFPEITLGFFPGWGGSQRSVRLIGKTKTLELILTGKLVTAEQALSMGIVDQVVSKESLFDTCRSMLKEIIQHSPLAIRFALKAVNEGQNMSFDSALVFESSLASMSCLTDEAEKSITGFLKKKN